MKKNLQAAAYNRIYTVCINYDVLNYGAAMQFVYCSLFLALCTMFLKLT